MSDSYTRLSHGEQDTRQIGTELAELLPDGSIIGLVGTLGAGKTRLVQAVAVATGIDVRDVVSPTYVVLHEYQGTRAVYHFDLYRLNDEDEFLELGADEYFDQPALTFLEWSDRFESLLPDERLEIKIDVLGEQERSLQFTPYGAQYEAVVQQLRSRLK